MRGPLPAKAQKYAIGGYYIRVLFLGAHLSKGGGQALQAYQLFRTLRQRVGGTFLCLDAQGPHRDMLQDSEVKTVGPLVFPGGILSLRRAVRSVRGSYDIVQVFDTYYALPAAYLARAMPMVVRLGTDPVRELEGRYGIVGKTAIEAALPMLLRNCHLVVNSAHLAMRFGRYKTHLIPNGVDFQRLERLPSRGDARQELGIRDDRPLLLFVGKVIPIKRLEWLLETVRRLPDARAIIVGGYNEEGYGDHYYRNLVRSFAGVMDRVTFTGEVPWEKVGKYLAAADIFAFPSSFEGMPNAVLEAMATGLPVVASDIPAHRALIQDGTTGLLAADVSSLTQMAKRLVQDEDLRNGIGKNARAFVQEHMSLERCAQLYLQLYESIASR